MRLKILNYAWHIGHQYELHRLPHDFFLLTGEGFRRWNFKSRPLRPNVKFVPVGGLRDGHGFDLAILHFDEDILEPSPSLPYPFRTLLECLRIPIIAICHGPAPFRPGAEGDAGAAVTVDESKRRAVIELIGERALVITNSHQAAREWRFPRSRTIWHGLDPDEYPRTTYERKVLTIINSLARKPLYQGHDLYRQAMTALPCDYLGKDPGREFRRLPPPRPSWSPWRMLWNAADFLGGKSDEARSARGWRRWISDGYSRAYFGAYRGLIARYSIYLNPTLRSPMPRSRLEALFCGLALVTTRHHDVDLWLEDGVTGFCADDAPTLRDRLRILCDDPALCRKLGRAGREMAQERFHISHFLAKWQDTIEEVQGSRR
ncbi:MAG TPA: glycosyltransferase [Candidatus Polarisedimenticolia bacterium]|jgi:glycosyltransferase involved in cell wall biosynthesis|nr:glycosyltransferase [Candidatus Polarisedimenticolia bacterium]